MIRFGVQLILLVGVLLGLLATATVQGQPLPARQPLYLQAGAFDPLSDLDPAGPALAGAADQAGPYYIVQFTGPVEAVWLAQLEQLGATILGYLPEHAHIMQIADADLARVQAMYAVRWVGPYRSAYKLAPAFNTPAVRAQATGVPGEVLVIAHPGVALADLSAFLREQGAIINDSADQASGAIVRVLITPDRIATLAANPAVAWIEPYSPPQLHNAEGRKIMGVESVWQSRSLFGADQIIAVSDSGLSVGQGANQSQLSADFAGRLIRAYAPSEMLPGSPQCAAKTNWTDLNGHGTHVAGSVLGSGALSGADPANRRYTGSHAGAAPQARMVFMAMNTDGTNSIQCIPINGNYIAFGYENGARISTNSWGFAGDSAYTQNSSIVDDYIWRHQDYLVLYAAGNAGRNGPRTIGAPATAKNVLTVGASENNRSDQGENADNPNEVAVFSSRGPTLDGRTKPDVLAPGTFILSVLGAEAGDLAPVAPGVPYAYSSGTSMATPLTAGVAAQVREWALSERNLSNPSAALLKALIIHGAVRMDGALPNFDSGWGRVDLKNTLDARYAVLADNRSGMTTGQQAEFTVQVAGSGSVGTLFVEPSAMLQSGSVDTLSFSAAPAQQGAAIFSAADVTVQTIPGYDTPPATHPIPEHEQKDALPQLRGPFALPQAPTDAPLLQPASAGDEATANAFAHNVVLAGTFENGTAQNPGWERYGQLWLGAGVPVRTSRARGQVALNGDASIWLGGSPSNDAIYYPLSFPRSIDSANSSGLRFLLAMTDLDLGFDSFCFAITDATGLTINNLRQCTDGSNLAQGTNTVTIFFDAATRSALAGKTGYLALFNQGDGITPHMSAYVDDVVLQVDYPNVALDALPSSGPPGTTFMLTGINTLPSFPVQVCSPNCASEQNIVATVYADARGDVLAYLSTKAQAAAGVYTVMIRDFAGRTATRQITLLGSTPTLTVTPPAGPAGTEFTISGTNFTPNDNRMTMKINGQDFGTLASDAGGVLRGTLKTATNTPPGAYTVVITDSVGRSATAQFQITAPQPGQATLRVSPTTGPAGTTFSFTGAGFTAGQAVVFTLDGQAMGSLVAEANGGFVATLSTSAAIPPGSYTMAAAQGERRATAQFQITGADDEQPQPNGNGLYVTLVWTDPPAQASAGRTLVNNLDLIVIRPDGTQALGNGGTEADQINNVEGVRIDQPTAGTYKIIVRATSVNGAFGAQPFALVATSGQTYNATPDDHELERGYRVYLPVLRR